MPVTLPSIITTSATTTKEVSTKSPILTILGTIQVLWGQCGGIRWPGLTNCGLSADCVFLNTHFSQCQPSKTIVDTGLPLYSQCGGIGWTGSTVCTLSAKCVYQNAYYSQCLPK